jgi:CheY-like chemotaxis protein
MTNDNNKTEEEMIKFEKETGKKAIWHGQITENFLKWKRGETAFFEDDKDRISLYLPEGMKDEWTTFYKSNNFSTLSSLIREAVKFFIKYRAKIIINNNGKDINLFSNISHDLKEPLTSIKGYLQLFLQKYGNSLEDDKILMIDNALNRCLTLENKIIEYLDNSEINNVKLIEKNNTKYDILLIEDDIETVNIITSYFEMKGITCRGVFNGSDGLKELKRATPKLVLLDIMLPNMSAGEIMGAIKSDNNLKDTPIFFLTAISETEAKKLAHELNASGLILKPFDLDQLDVVLNYLQIDN